MDRKRQRLARVFLGLTIGAFAGLITFVVTRTTGPALFTITGAMAGAVTVLALQAFSRSAELTEVRVSVPHFSQLTFMVNNDSRLVAWKLFVEASTRVSTQSLDDSGGLLREAMNSLYSLFSTTRETLKSAQPSRAGDGPTVEYLAVRCSTGNFGRSSPSGTRAFSPTRPPNQMAQNKTGMRRRHAVANSATSKAASVNTSLASPALPVSSTPSPRSSQQPPPFRIQTRDNQLWLDRWAHSQRTRRHAGISVSSPGVGVSSGLRRCDQRHGSARYDGAVPA